MLKDIFESVDDSLYDPEDDQRVYKITDTRKPKLTLSVLNKLRMYRMFKKTEDEKRDLIVSAVYASAPQQEL